MPLVDTSPRWRPALNRVAGLRPVLLLPFRPFAFVAKRTLLLCGVILISYVMITNMIGYDSLWSNPIPSITDGTTNIDSRLDSSVAVVDNVAHGKEKPHRTDLAKSDVGMNAIDMAEGNETVQRRQRPKKGIRGEGNGIVEDQQDFNVFEKNNSINERKEGDANESDATGGKRAYVDNVDVEGGKLSPPILGNSLLNQTDADASEEHKQRHSKTRSSTKLPLCPLRPPDLTGKMKQAVLLMSMLKESDVMRSHPEMSRGGHWKPKHCQARYKVAIIVPFRDRQSHLNRLIDFLIPMLERQLLDFRFIVTEQYGKDLFNKGRIMNAAFLLAETLRVDCVIYHDVDMFPQDDRNFYYCPDEPKHLGAFVNTLGYELWYDYIVGGVLAINMEHYRQINGYSNMYWAWGGEDDDMGYRILANNLTILRPEKEHGTYTMLKHVKRQRTAPSMIYKLLNTAKTRWATDGLNKVQWKVVKLIVKPLYYHLYVDVGIPPDEWRHEKAKTGKKKR